MSKSFGLLGEKLGHSFSPLIHSCLGDYQYRLYEVPPDGLDSFMTERNFDGINVTIPYKQDVMDYCETLSDEARAIGCVNTIIKDKNGDLHGYNTDYYGFKTMLEHGNINPKRKKVLVLGNGGSAKTVRAVLNYSGAEEIITVSRLGENNYSNIAKHHDAELIINTTPVGMYPNNGTAPVCIKGFKQLTGVADLIYNPARTKLIMDAERLGISCVSGLSMLIAQAKRASMLFNGESYRELDIKNIISKILRETQNIAIIGMPGCGKSSVGRALAAMTDKPFSDIDMLVEASSGRCIPEIFAKSGEEVFRKMETRALSEESKKSGQIIATGGGIVTIPENLDLLRQNSFIVYLKRDLNELNIIGRPLSDSIGIKTLAKQRLPLYEAWSDCVVEAGESIEQTATRIISATKKEETT